MPSSFPVRSHTARVAVLALLLAAAAALVPGGAAQAQPIKPSFWGMHDSDWTTAPEVPVGSANFTTSGTYWPNIETSEGVYDWTRLDAQVEGAEAMNAQPMIVLGQSPQFHSSQPGSPDYDDHMPDLAAWRTYVSKVAAAYGDRLDYQIWPEPNIVQNWQGTPRQMAQLTMVAAKAIHSTAPRAKVVSPAMALRLPGQRRWMVSYFKQAFKGKRVHTFVDAIAVDPFPERTGSPEDSYGLMRSARSALAKIKVRKPLWNNEINYGVTGGGESTTVEYPVAKQQSYVIRTYALSAAAGMQRAYWLGWFTTETMAVQMADADGNTLAPGTSYGVVRSWLNRTRFVGCDRGRSGLWTCVAKKGRKEVRRIYWNPSRRTSVSLPRSAKRVENQSGGVDSTPPRRIRVTYRPIMVASRT